LFGNNSWRRRRSAGVSPSKGVGLFWCFVGRGGSGSHNDFPGATLVVVEGPRTLEFRRRFPDRGRRKGRRPKLGERGRPELRDVVNHVELDALPIGQDKVWNPFSCPVEFASLLGAEPPEGQHRRRFIQDDSLGA
jgi:hypothetical protein